jgi:hypothetical protein
MDLRFRLPREDDLTACRSLISERFAYSQEVWEALPILWKRLLLEDAARATVIEDVQAEPRVVAFGMTVFAEQTFVDRGLAHPMSGLVNQVYLRELSRATVILRPPAIAPANASGDLTLLFMHFAHAPGDLTTEPGAEIVALSHRAFDMTHRGYHCRRLLREVFGRQEAEFTKAFGFRLIADDASSDEGDPERRPRLFGLSREDHASSPYHPFSHLFTRHAPRFGFSRAEQALLFRAVMGETDEAMAQALSVSLATVHKRWRSIFDRVTGVLPDMFPLKMGPRDAGRRGLEKRRHLLRYLLEHLEELRPYGRETPSASRRALPVKSSRKSG